LGTLTLIGLPSGLASGVAPSGWNGYLVQLTGYSDRVSAEAGVGSAAPTSSTTGTLSFWNGTGYTFCAAPFTSCLIGGSFPVATLTASGTQQQNPLLITVTADLRPGGTATTDPANCGSSC